MKTFLKGIALFGTVALVIANFVVLYALLNPDQPIAKRKPAHRASISWNV